MYYIMSAKGRLLESQEHCPSRSEMEIYAAEFRCSIWVIEGQHSGLEMAFAPEEAKPTHQEPDFQGLQAELDRIDEALPMAAATDWNKHHRLCKRKREILRLLPSADVGMDDTIIGDLS